MVIQIQMTSFCSYSTTKKILHTLCLVSVVAVGGYHVVVVLSPDEAIFWPTSLTSILSWEAFINTIKPLLFRQCFDGLRETTNEHHGYWVSVWFE